MLICTCHFLLKIHISYVPSTLTPIKNVPCKQVVRCRHMSTGRHEIYEYARAEVPK